MLVEANAKNGYFSVVLAQTNTSNIFNDSKEILKSSRCQQPRKLTYAGLTPILNIEVRASKALLKGQPIDVAIKGIYCTDISLYYYESGQFRQEGDYLILPWFGYLHNVKDWDITVPLAGKESYFQLNLPRRPKESTRWSDWTVPTPHFNCITPAGLSIRCRFQLAP